MKNVISISLLALVPLLMVGCNKKDSSNSGTSDIEPLKRASSVKLSDFTVNSKFLSRAKIVQEINYQDDFYLNEPISGAGSEDTCFFNKYDEAYASNTFKKNADGTFYLDIPIIDYSECSTDGETSKVSKFLDNVLVVDYNGALIDIEGKTLYRLPTNTYIKQQRSITTWYLAWTYQDVEIVDTIIEAYVGLNGFETPCELKSPVQCSFYETTDVKYTEIDGEVWGGVYRSVLTANTSFSNGNDMFFDSGTIDFTINNWSGIMSYTGENSYPTYVANSDSESVSGTFQSESYSRSSSLLSRENMDLTPEGMLKNLKSKMRQSQLLLIKK